MRKPQSIFNTLVEFINAHAINDTYENSTMHTLVKGPVIIKEKYQRMLNRADFISRSENGQWTVLRKIPDWFTAAHLQKLMGYDYTSIEFKKDGIMNIRLRLKMTKEEIIEKLQASSTEITSTNMNTEKEIPVCTTKKISPEESVFYQQPDSFKYSAQLHENLLLNAGYIHSAIAILDQTEFLDPVLHGRLLNIFAQLQDLQRVIEERTQFRLTKPVV